MKIADSFLDLVGKTPLVRVHRLNPSGYADVVLKLEGFNPVGSSKDRIAFAMIASAEQLGHIKPGGAVLIEATSGNTGIALASAAARHGYNLLLTMPDSASLERRIILLAFGAEIVLTPGKLGLKGAVAKAEELHSTTPHGFLLSQFQNASNPGSHYATTGPEIWDDTDGKVDMVVCCAGTGGTITGISRYIKARKPEFRAIAVEPTENALLSGGATGPHQIVGAGVDVRSDVIDRTLIDEILCVTSARAIEKARSLAKQEGILAGISSGAALEAALILSHREENRGKLIVAVLPDTGDRYLSGILFQPLRDQAAALPTAAAATQANPPLRRIR